MSTNDYIPLAKEAQYLPKPPSFSQESDGQSWALEIGPGKGEFLLHLAQENPHSHFIGLEIKRGRFERIAKKANLLQLPNLYMIRADARECLPRLFPQKLFQKIYILFPDPWPKTRHGKHRLIKPRLVNELEAILKENGEIYSATDAGFYSDQIVAAFQEAGGFAHESIESLYPTYFEKKWKTMGREIDYWKFIKR